MTAFFLEDITANLKAIMVADEQFHHYKNVSRGRVGEKVIVLNGNGLALFAEVEKIGKKSYLRLNVMNIILFVGEH